MIVVEKLSKKFPTKQEAVQAIRGISFTVAAGEMLTLLGPSGCGKTTALRCIAGLERPDDGSISIDGVDMVDAARGSHVPANRRNIGMVFQSYAIWPHMTVLENVAYALGGKGIRRDEVRSRSLAALEQVQLAGLADRPAPRLSGGQQQRVAIARALVARPRALLFDEPLSNLDSQLRLEMRVEIRRLQQQTSITSLYVTHDQSEALAISDWIVVMRAGEIIEYGRPTDIYRCPRHVFTAQFLGQANLIPGIVAGRDSQTGMTAVETPLGKVRGRDPSNSLRPAEPVRVMLRPEDLAPADQATAQENRISGHISVATFLGSVMEVHVVSNGVAVIARVGRGVQVERGAQIGLAFSAENAVVLRDEAASADTSKFLHGDTSSPAAEQPPVRATHSGELG